MSKFNGPAASIEDNRNKVSSITERSTNTQYPTAKAVFDLFNQTGTSGGCIRLWQPNTEYKDGDIVIVNFSDRDISDPEDTLPNRTIIAKCVIQHKSTNSFALNNYGFEDVWEILQEIYAYYDALGNRIHNTYATKNELAEAIGQALEGDY